MSRPFRATHLSRVALLRAANALAPINILPREVLVEVFSILAASPPPDEDEDQWWQEPDGDLKWLAVTEVCHHWYDVARHTPTLWQVIDVYTNVEWLKLCFERSVDVPLDIRFHDRHAAEDAQDIVIRHASRISKLYVLPGEDCSSLGWLHYLRKIPLPLLKEFNVVGGPGLRVDRTCHPALEIFRAATSDVAWNSIPVEHLRVLDLEMSMPSFKDRVPNLDAFLRILGSFQKLEYLDLNFSIPVGDLLAARQPGYWDSSLLIHLPRLHKLRFSSNHSSHVECDVLAVLSHLRLARSTSVDIWMGLEDLENFRGLPGLLPQDSNNFPFLLDATSASIHHGTRKVVFTVRVDSGATLSVRYEMVAGGLMKDAYSPDDALFHLCTLFSKAQITRLNIPCPAFVGAFRMLSGLQLLTVSLGGRKRDLVRFLSALSADGGRYDGGAVLPALRGLDLTHVSWKETMLEDLAKCLRTRAARNAAKLSVLRIEVAPGKNVPNDEDLEDMLDELAPFVEDYGHLECHNGL
ncbi:hypothetical protein OH76DRAFT_1469230 [Lentinus brumalis]|uniref:Uncharacterized protein n=1 Tax=Lentinus brumalis TaxID=2498619 RepID=A0A371DPQ8_9APHY|nr:hypothetical protein OH76DRAFT_1469230 [Polyporus brumalis]